MNFALNLRSNSMSLPTNCCWTKLKPIPSKSITPYYQILFEKKSNALIALPYFFSVNPEAQNTLFKYSFTMNSWKTYQIQTTNATNVIHRSEYMKIFDHSKDTRILFPASIHQNKIFIICNNNMNEIAMLEMNHTYQTYNNATTCTIKFIEYVTSMKILSIITSLNIMKDHFYCFSDTHFIKYNINTKTHQILPNPSIQNHLGPSMIQTENKLILFGKIDHKTPSIQQYDIINNYWEILPVKLPKEIRFISTTTILNQQIILIFGININPYIFIYEIKTNTFKKSNIKLPNCIKRCNQIFAINDEKHDNFVANAWINKNSINIPLTLHLIITQYYTNEIIHLINPKTGDHYNIDVIHILNS